MRRWPSFERFVLNDTANDSLDRSGGGVFLNLIRPAMLD
jgi:hypothetical protein